MEGFQSNTIPGASIGQSLIDNFDLRALSAERASMGQRMRLLLGLFDVLALGFALWFLKISFGLGRSPETFQWVGFDVVEIVSLSLALILSYAVLNTRRGPYGLAIDEAGIRFRWPSGSEERLPWIDLTRRFVLLDYSSNRFVVENLSMLQWEVRRWNRPASSLTKDAFDAIVTGAKVAGLVVTSEDLKKPTWGWAPCRAVRFVQSRPP
jgi:hypothetical protein